MKMFHNDLRAFRRRLLSLTSSRIQAWIFAACICFCLVRIKPRVHAYVSFSPTSSTVSETYSEKKNCTVPYKLLLKKFVQPSLGSVRIKFELILKRVVVDYFGLTYADILGKRSHHNSLRWHMVQKFVVLGIRAGRTEECIVPLHILPLHSFHIEHLEVHVIIRGIMGLS